MAGELSGHLHRILIFTTPYKVLSSQLRETAGEYETTNNTEFGYSNRIPTTKKLELTVRAALDLVNFDPYQLPYAFKPGLTLDVAGLAAPNEVIFIAQMLVLSSTWTPDSANGQEFEASLVSQGVYEMRGDI